MMFVDRGEIVGGFERTYDAWIDDDSETALARKIAAATGLDERGGLWVTVETRDGSTWSREFAPAFGAGSIDADASCLFSTPLPEVLGVRVRGIAFVVDVTCPDDCKQLDVVPLRCAASDVTGGRLFLADDTRVYGFDGARVLWRSPRMALDGIRDLGYADGYVHGVAAELGGTTSRFRLEALTGEPARLEAAE